MSAIDGVLEISKRPDVFISEELTASFRGEPQAVHILCYGITAEDHEWLQAHNGDVESCAEYLHLNDILGAIEGNADLMDAAVGVFESCMAAIPYAPATAFLGNEKAKLYSREDETPRVAILADDNFDAIHVCSPGPVGIAGALVARGLRLPLVGSYHTELTAYAALRSQDPRVASAMDLAVRSFYDACDLVLSPSPASDQALRQLGVSDQRTTRWDRGVDTARFDPSLRRRLAAAGLAAVRERTWESALERLAGGYRRALSSASGAHGNDTQGRRHAA